MSKTLNFRFRAYTGSNRLENAFFWNLYFSIFLEILGQIFDFQTQNHLKKPLEGPLRNLKFENLGEYATICEVIQQTRPKLAGEQ